MDVRPGLLHGARVCVTGGAGFVGSHLCDALVASGATVVVLDDLRTGRRENIGHLLDVGSVTLVEADVTEHVSVPGTLDAVLHLASPASPIDYLRMPIETLKAGSVGTWHTLGLALAKRARFLLASTSEVYGDPDVHPQPETYWGRVDPTGPRAVYDEAKRFAETLTLAYHRTRGLDTRIARIFNTYGPRMRVDDGRVVPSFVTAALAGQPLVVHGDGAQTRTLCHVRDLVAGLVELLVVDADSPPGRAPGERAGGGVDDRGEESRDVHLPVNLGGDDEVSVLGLARLVLELTGSSSPIVHEPRAIDDPRRRRPDLARAASLLGYTPRTPLHDGLSETIGWYRGAVGAT